MIVIFRKDVSHRNHKTAYSWEDYRPILLLRNTFGPLVSVGLLTNRGLVGPAPIHFTSISIPVGATEHK